MRTQTSKLHIHVFFAPRTREILQSRKMLHLRSCGALRAAPNFVQYGSTSCKTSACHPWFDRLVNVVVLCCVPQILRMGGESPAGLERVACNQLFVTAGVAIETKNTLDILLHTRLVKNVWRFINETTSTYNTILPTAEYVMPTRVGRRQTDSFPAAA